MVKKHIAAHALSEDERRALISIIEEQHGLALPEDVFADVMLGLFEDIPGFETMPPATSRCLVNQLWSHYMAKKPVSVESTDATNSTTETVEPDAAAPQPIEIDLNKPVIRASIAKGQALIAEGKTKADAARAIYEEIPDEPKELIVAAFVQGAALTEKGALTYWYNCRRQAAKRAAQRKDAAGSKAATESVS